VIQGTTSEHTTVTAKYRVHGDDSASGTYVEDLDADLSSPEVQEVVADLKSTVKREAMSVPGRTASSGYSYSTKENSQQYYTYSDYELESRNTVLDKTESDRTIDIDNAIFVGDTDAFGAGYVASGDASMTTNIDEYYTHHDSYVRDKVVDTVNTTSYEILFDRLISPIVLDLDGDGAIEASNGKYLPHQESFDASHTTLFDFHGNAFPVMTEWVGRNDGLLCRPHANGSVDGTCLFGTSNGFSNGYDELASLDADKSGALEGAELNGLMVWVDANGRGTADASELHTLSSLGITSIGVTHDNMAGTFMRNGQVQKSFDWWPTVVECRKVDMARR